MLSASLKRICVSERIGTEPVPAIQQQSGFSDSFVIMINYLINPGTIVSAAMGVAGGLEPLTVVLVQCSAVMLSMVAFLVMARIGVDYGLTGQMACRAALGVRGGKWLTSPLRALCSIYWFAFQTLAGSLAIAALLKECLGLELTLVQVSLPFAFLQVVVAAVGYHWLKGLFVWALPLKLISLVVVISLLFQARGGVSLSFGTDFQTNWLLIMAWFNGIFGGMLTMITDAADFTRYQHSRKALWAGALSGSGAGILLGAVTGAYAMSLVGGSADNLFEGILQIAPGAVMAIAILVLIVMDNWTINVINLYSGGLSLCHTLEKLGRFKCTLLVSVPSILLSCFPDVIHRYLDILSATGCLFAAIAGVLMMDYWLREWHLEVTALYQKEGVYWYQQGFKISSLLVILISAYLGSMVPENWPGAVVTLVLAGASYFLLNRGKPV